MSNNHVNIPDSAILDMASNRYKLEMPESFYLKCENLKSIQEELNPSQKLLLLEALVEYLNIGTVKKFRDENLQRLYRAILDDFLKALEKQNLKKIKNQYAYYCLKCKRACFKAEKFDKWFMDWLDE